MRYLLLSLCFVWFAAAQEKPDSPKPIPASEMSRADRDAYLCAKYGCDRPVDTFREAATNGSTRWFVLGYAASTYFDLAATQKCISEHTCKEGNPVLGNNAAQRWGIGTALVVVTSWAAIKLRQENHGTIADVILTAASTVHISLGIDALRRK